jgi:hypothetical protein
VIFGERHLCHLLREFVAHYHSERYHQGIGSRLILPLPGPNADNATLGAVRCVPASADSSTSTCVRPRNPRAAIPDTTGPPARRTGPGAATGTPCGAGPSPGGCVRTRHRTDSGPRKRPASAQPRRLHPRPPCAPLLFPPETGVSASRAPCLL